MKRFILILIAAAIFALPVFSQPLTAEQKKGAEEVLATISMWADAVRDRDPKALDQIFAEDLFITLSDGQIRRKKDEMDSLKMNPAFKNISIANDDVEIRMVGETAVVTALLKWLRLRLRDNQEVPINMRYTAVFTKRGGRWQLVVLQVANFAPPSPTAPPATKQ